MPRVTEVIGYMLEPELLKWMLRNSEKKRNEIRDEAFRVGSLVDGMVQDDIKDYGYLVPEGDEQVVNCMNGWENFKVAHPEFVGSVYSMQDNLEDKETGVTGHPDFVIRRKDSWGIVDLKTSTSIRPTYWTQTAQYSEMVKKRDGLTFPRFIAVLRVDKKTGVWEYQEISDEKEIQYEVDVFKAMLLMYNHCEKVRERTRLYFEDLKQ